MTNSSDFPVISGAVNTHGISLSAFAVGLAADGGTLLYSTYYRTFDDVFGCATGSGLVMAGRAPSGSEVIGVPVRPRIGGWYDGYVARLSPGAVGISDIGLAATSTRGRSGTLDMSLSVTNQGPDAATSVVLRGAASPDRSFSVDLGSVPAGVTVGLPITVSAEVTGPLDVWFWTVANQSDPNGANDVASSHATIPGSHLTTTVSGTPADVAQGEEVLVRVMVSNSGPDAAEAVEALVSLPGWWQPGAAGVPTQCSPVPDTGQLLCLLGAVQAGAAADVLLSIKLIAPGPSSFTSRTTSMSLDPQPIPEGAWTVNVRSADAFLTATPSTAVLYAGQMATFQLSLGATAGIFQAPFTLDCAGLPPGTTCRFTPASLSPSGGNASGVVVIETTARTAMAGSTSIPGGSLLAVACLALLGAAVLPIGRAAPKMTGWATAIGVLAFVAACRGTGSPPSAPGPSGGTPAGTYAVTVTATLQATMGFDLMARSTQLTITVK